jgi:hypothetical protein
MCKGCRFGIVLMLAFAGTASAEVGAGITVTYPIGAAIMYGDIYGGSLDPQPLFFGPVARWKFRALYFEAAVRYWPHGAMFHGNANVGLSGDLSFLRFGFSGGFDGILLPLSGSGGITKSGWNLKVDIDVLFKPIVVGFSVAFPMDLIQNLQGHGYALVEPYDELRAYAGQASINVMYRFADSRGTKVK